MTTTKMEGPWPWPPRVYQHQRTHWLFVLERDGSVRITSPYNELRENARGADLEPVEIKLTAAEWSEVIRQMGATGAG